MSRDSFDFIRVEELEHLLNVPWVEVGIRALEELSVDKVFMTTNALSLQKGATTPNLDNAEIKRAMMKIGNQRYLLCDSSKIGTKNCLFICKNRGV